MVKLPHRYRQLRSLDALRLLLTAILAISHWFSPFGVADVSAQSVTLERLQCLKQQEDSPDEIIIKVSADGQAFGAPMKREGITTGTSWEIQLTVPAQNQISVTLIEEDTDLIDPDDNLGTATIQLTSNEASGHSDIFGEGAEYRIHWKISTVTESESPHDAAASQIDATVPKNPSTSPIDQKGSSQQLEDKENKDDRPSNLIDAILYVFWETTYGLFAIVCVCLIWASFHFWNSLPDTRKEALLDSIFRNRDDDFTTAEMKHMVAEIRKELRDGADRHDRLVREALELTLTATVRTINYLAKIRDDSNTAALEGNLEFAKLWNEVGLKINAINDDRAFELANRCFMKAEHWADPSTWRPRQRRQVNIRLRDLRDDLEEFLADVK